MMVPEIITGGTRSLPHLPGSASCREGYIFPPPNLCELTPLNVATKIRRFFALAYMIIYCLFCMLQMCSRFVELVSQTKHVACKNKL